MADRREGRDQELNEERGGGGVRRIEGSQGRDTASEGSGKIINTCSSTFAKKKIQLQRNNKTVPSSLMLINIVF